eukprot:TRINITY_DN10174_c0_g1_i1.p1 TRINITY_DN10174_c0_g1~~TRINITY_DN10174_c0_g1_i1.p1  ORF type:complete len:159 (+),score=11.13 TRINITY_DN10174_c0_g1_i1:81-557(+)
MAMKESWADINDDQSGLDSVLKLWNCFQLDDETGTQPKQCSTVDASGVLVNLVPHARGTCKPCWYVGGRKGCRHGTSCSFCHMHHPDFKHVPTKRVRPCKAKRERLRRKREVLQGSETASQETEETIHESDDLRSQDSECYVRIAYLSFENETATDLP